MSSSKDLNANDEILSSYSMSIIATSLFEFFSFGSLSKDLLYEGFSESRSKK